MNVLVLLPVGEILLTMFCGALLRHLLPAPRRRHDRRLLATFTMLVILLSVSAGVRGVLTLRNNEAQVAALAKAMSQDLSLLFIERPDFDIAADKAPATRLPVPSAKMQLARVRFDFAHHLYRDKAYPAATQQLQAVTRLVASAACYNNLAVLALHSGDTSRAILYLNRALQLDPSLSAAHYNLGVVYLRTKRSLSDILEQFSAAGAKER